MTNKRFHIIFISATLLMSIALAISIPLVARTSAGTHSQFLNQGIDLTTAGFAVNVLVTAYAPGAGGLNSVEGPFKTSKPNNIDGKFIPMTLDCVRQGQCSEVTLASDKSNYGNYYYIGEVQYQSPIDRRIYTLKNVIGYVHDTGGAFRGRPDKMDVAIGNFSDTRKWSHASAARFVDSQPFFKNKRYTWRQIVGPPPGHRSTVSGSYAGPASQAIDQATGGALRGTAFGRFLGIPNSQNRNVPRTTRGGSSRVGNNLASKQPPILRNTPTPTTNSTPTPTPTTSQTPTPLTNTPPPTQTIPPRTIKNTTPTLLCLPNPIAPGEEALILWSCRDGAYKTTSNNFNTNEALIGSTRVRPTTDTTYTIECINNLSNISNTAASCSVNVANPALAVIATPRSATRGQTISLSWKTKDVNSCILTSSEHPNFERRGIEGDITSPSLTRNTTFTLTCETTTGTIKEKVVGVGVN